MLQRPESASVLVSGMLAALTSKGASSPVKPPCVAPAAAAPLSMVPTQEPPLPTLLGQMKVSFRTLLDASEGIPQLAAALRLR